MERREISSGGMLWREDREEQGSIRGAEKTEGKREAGKEVEMEAGKEAEKEAEKTRNRNIYRHRNREQDKNRHRDRLVTIFRVSTEG